MSELLENGLPLEQYLIKYQRGDNGWQPWTTPATVEQARATIIAIRKKQPVSILLLEPIISLPYHPQALHLLYNPSLIHDCIWLLSRLQMQESQSVRPCGISFFTLIFEFYARLSHMSLDIFSFRSSSWPSALASSNEPSTTTWLSKQC